MLDNGLLLSVGIIILCDTCHILAFGFNIISDIVAINNGSELSKTALRIEQESVIEAALNLYNRLGDKLVNEKRIVNDIIIRMVDKILG